MTRLPHASPGSRRFRLSLLSGLVLLQALLAVSQAAVTSAITGDGTLGTMVTQSGRTYTIGGGTLRGSNLFQSFDRLSVGTGDTAAFTGPMGTTNILSRVTGGQPSSIDGRLQSTIPGANLYLLNPSGVLFGSNASLNVQGSFHVSTADFVRLADGGTFFANLGQESRLTVAAPAAFGFLGNTPAPVTIQGSRLSVGTGRALSVVGGDIEIVGGSLAAPRGRIQLASVVSPGDMIFSPLELAPDLQVDSFARLGRIALSRGANVTVSSNAGAGTVLIRGSQLMVDNAFINANTSVGESAPLGIDVRLAEDIVLTNGAGMFTQSQGAGRAGELRLTAGGLMLTGNAAIEGGGTVFIRGERLVMDNSFISVATLEDVGGARIDIRLTGDLAISNAGAILATPFGSGRGGDISLEVGRLTLTGGSEINTSPYPASTGSAGNLTIIAKDSISISGLQREPFFSLSGLVAITRGEGEGGNIFISTPTLKMEGGIIESLTVGNGNAGNITVKVGSLTLTGGAQISSSSGAIDLTTGELVVGRGQGGDLTIAADALISLSGRDSDGFPSAFSTETSGPGNAGHLSLSTPILKMEDGFISSATEGDGRAGNLMLDVGRVTLTGGAQISSSSGQRLSDGTIRVGRGQGGDLIITAKDLLSIAGRDSEGSPSGLSSNTRGVAQGGNIQVQAKNIELSDGGTISARSSGEGAAGNIRIQTGETFHSHHGQVTTTAEQAGGGTIALRAGRLVQLQDSELTTTVQSGGGDAGNLTLDAPFIVAEGSQIIANAFGGQGGNIRIGAEVFLADPVSLISASSALGIQGTVNIQAPVTSLSGTLAPLPQAFVNVVALLPARCAARFSGGQASSLVLGGRGGLPLDPSGMLPSPLALDAQLMAEPPLTGVPHRQTSAARFALLAGHEKGLPRLAGDCAK